MTRIVGMTVYAAQAAPWDRPNLRGWIHRSRIIIPFRTCATAALAAILCFSRRQQDNPSPLWRLSGRPRRSPQKRRGGWPIFWEN